MKPLRLSGMRPFLASFAMAALIAGSVSASEPIAVAVDQARVVEMPAGAATLIVGNPAIADVTILKRSNAMVITGKGFGQTNLVALDKTGKPVAESPIVVRSNPSVMLVQRGLKRQSYSCAPECLPSVQLGDDTEAFTGAAAQIDRRNQMATQGPQR